jgi:hypothetical protein
MLKIFIKFNVVEIAIGIFFDILYTEFGPKSNQVNNVLTVGERLTQIDIAYIDKLEKPNEEHIYGFISYYECTVLQTTPISAYIEYLEYEEHTFDYEATALDESGERQRDYVIVEFNQIVDIIR